MSDSRTAITCPQHTDCVVVVSTCLDSQLDGRKPLKHQMWLDPWLNQWRSQGGWNDRAITDITHHAAESNPDKLLIERSEDEQGHTKILARLDKLEAFATRRKRGQKRWDRNV